MLLLARWTGLFQIARYITGRDLRIITYHGGSIGDEHLFRGGLFISLSVFKSRLELLKRRNYPVIGLKEGVEQLKAGTLKPGSVVITLDDGWYSTRSLLAPALKQYGFCSTLYVSSYYVKMQTAVFNVAVDYVMWKSDLATIDLKTVDARLEGIYSLQTAEGRGLATQRMWDFANALDSAIERQELLERVATVVAVDYSNIEKSRSMSYMTSVEVSELDSFGVNVQLHTHRHSLPDSDFALTEREIGDNRQALQGLNSQPLCHFCYPSGEYQEWQPEWLSRLGIESATTTHRGFNRRDQSPLELNRFLDWDNFCNLHFEAEVSGFLELVRRLGVRV